MRPNGYQGPSRGPFGRCRSVRGRSEVAIACDTHEGAGAGGRGGRGAGTLACRRGCVPRGLSDRLVHGAARDGAGRRPVVRKPLLVPPDVLPVDQGALAGITVPVDPSDYVRAALDLAADVDGRQRQAAANRDSMLRHHCGAAWDQRLTELGERLPREHDPAVRSDVPPIPFELAAYWTRYRVSRGNRDAFMIAFLAGLERGLHPRVDAAITVP